MTGITIERYLPDGFLADSLRADARAGLTSSPKVLPPKWFYDERGSELFDKITLLDEYYPTRAERAILRSAATEIAAASGARTLIELGSGSADKTRLLLDALRAAGTLRSYVQVDVSEAALVAASAGLLASYPGLELHAVVSDFEEHLGLPDGGGPKLVAFLGGTIGNLLPAQRAAFLARIAAGLAAAFNKNILQVLNTGLGANFDLDAFDHVARWDPEAEWIEMRLRSACRQEVTLPAIGLQVSFAEGEEMRTEVSAKFRRGGVRAELAAAGLDMRSWWTDPAGRFGLSLSVPV